MTKLHCLLYSLLLLTGVAAAQESEQPIRKSIDEYVSAFNRGDLAALEACWTENAVWNHADGTKSIGREEIRGQLANGVAGKGVLEIAASELRFVTPEVAIEEGIARLSIAGQPMGEEHYEAIHVSTPQGWKMSSLREFPRLELPTNTNLEPLSWLLGEWTDQSESTTVRSSVTWSRNQAFLINNFKVEFEGEDSLDGVQIIGWDPAAQIIRSWVFDSDGAIGQGIWQPEDDHWVVKSSMTLANGSQATSTNFYHPQTPNSYVWRSIGRSVDNQFLPNIDNVLVVRKGTETDPASADVSEHNSGGQPTEPAGAGPTTNVDK